MGITVSNSCKAGRHGLEIKKGLIMMSSCAVSEVTDVVDNSSYILQFLSETASF